MTEPSVHDYDDETGDVVNIYQCRECGEALRVEYRSDLPVHMMGLACPNGCTGLPVRIRDAARLDEAFDSRHPWNCFECQEEVLDEDHPTTANGHPLHPDGCADEYLADMDHAHSQEVRSR